MSKSLFPEIPGLRFVRKEGKGACGTVYRARETKTNVLVAVKQLSRRLSARPKFLQSVEAGVARLAGTRGEQVVKPSRIHRTGDRYYVLTEFVSGENLRDMLRQRGRIPEAEAAEIIAQAARGLETAALVGQIHYDLKPSNISVSDDGSVRLMDFFMDFHSFVRSVPAQQVLELKEFPLYISPEERDFGEITLQSNIFSLGAIFHHLVFGVPLLDVEGRRPGDWRLPESVHVSPGTRKMIRWMTNEQPQARCGSYLQVREALARLSENGLGWKETALFASVAGALLLTLVLFMPRGKQEDTSSRAVPSSAASSSPDAHPAGRKLSAQASFEEAEAFRTMFPGKVTDILAKYREIARNFPDTPYAYNAQDIVAKIELQIRKEETDRWNTLLAKLEALKKEHRYREAIRELRSFAGENRRPRPGKVERLIRRVQVEERDAFGLLRWQLVRVASLRGVPGVQKELEFAARQASTDQIGLLAGKEWARVRDWLEQSSNLKQFPFRKEAVKDAEMVREWMLSFVLDMDQLRFEQAIALCRAAVARIKQPEIKSALAFFASSVAQDRVFVNRLLGRIRENECEPRPVVRGPKGRRWTVFWAASNGLTVTKTGDEKFRWAELSGLEIGHLLEQSIRQNSSRERLELARSFLLRGLWGKMSDTLELAAREEPALKKTADEYHDYVARLNRVLLKGE